MELQFVDILGNVLREPSMRDEAQYEIPCSICGARWGVYRYEGEFRSASQRHRHWCGYVKQRLIWYERQRLKETTRRVLLRTRSRWAVR